MAGQYTAGCGAAVNAEQSDSWKHDDSRLELLEDVVDAEGIFMGIKGSGVVYLHSPRPDDFQPEPVADALADIARYAGNYGRYTVAQHAVLVARVVARHGGDAAQVLAAVHHDDAEAVTNDIPRPLKEYVRCFTAVLDTAIDRLDAAIEARYQVDISDPLVKWADMAVYHFEVQRLIPPEERWKYEPLPDVAGLILPYEWFIPWTHDEARARYLDIHNKMTTIISIKEVPVEFQRECS